jgi:hypothetical protein
MDERHATGALSAQIEKFEELGVSDQSTLDSRLIIDDIVTECYSLEATVHAHSSAALAELEFAAYPE